MTETQLKPCIACRENIDASATRCPRCTERQPMASRFYRDLPARRLGGVAAAVAQRLNLEVALVRVLWIIAVFAFGTLPFWGYLLAWIFTPYSPGSQAPAVRLFSWLGQLFSTPVAVEPRDVLERQ